MPVEFKRDNPQVLRLELHTEAPGGNVPQMITPTPVNYQQETDFDYNHVAISPSRVTIELQRIG